MSGFIPNGFIPGVEVGGITGGGGGEGGLSPGKPPPLAPELPSDESPEDFFPSGESPGKGHSSFFLFGEGSGDGAGSSALLSESPQMPAWNIPNRLPSDPLAGCQRGAGAGEKVSVGFLGNDAGSGRSEKSSHDQHLVLLLACMVGAPGLSGVFGFTLGVCWFANGSSGILKEPLVLGLTLVSKVWPPNGSGSTCID